MKYSYVVLGSGRQGMAAAYDFGRFGDAKQIVLTDVNEQVAANAAAQLSKLLDTELVTSTPVDIQDEEKLKEILIDADVCLSAVPYRYNAELTRLAIAAKCHFCDLGGNTEIVMQQHKSGDQAKQSEVTIAPDCGLAPGMANILAAYGIKALKKPRRVHIRVGGLPQFPRPPLGYTLSFSIEGLTNEYFGSATILRDGKVTDVPTFTELEEIEFPAPVGTCEAFMTAGGTSTCPWTFEGILEEYEEKTVRYPGHYEKMKTMVDLGLLGLEPVDVEGWKVVPRELFHTVVEPLLQSDDVRDVVVLRVIVTGEQEQIVFDLLDYFDEATGLTAMQRTTGFGAAIVGIMLAWNELPSGSIRIEEAVDPEKYVAEMAKRGFELNITK